MRIRKGFQVAVRSRPVLIVSKQTPLIRPLDATSTSCGPKSPNIKANSKGSQNDVSADLFNGKCISSVVDESSEDGSEKVFLGMKKEEEGDYSSRKERCIMCGEAGHSCFQQLDVSHATLRPFRDRAFEGVDGVTMLRKPDRVETFKSAQSQCYSSGDVHYGDKRVRSFHTRKRSEKTFPKEAKKRQKPNDVAHNGDDSQEADKLKGNEFERKEVRKKMKVAGMWTQRVEAPKRSQQKSALLSNEQVICDLITDIANSSETRVRDSLRGGKREASMQNDSGSLILLSSGVTEISAASCKGCSAAFNPSSRMIEADRSSAARNAPKIISYSLGIDNEILSEASQKFYANKFSQLKVEANQQKFEADQPISGSALPYTLLNHKDKPTNRDCQTQSNDYKQIEDGNIESAGARKQPATQADAEYRRCKRKDGKGWQCQRKAEAGYSLCEYHLGKFRANHTRKKAATKIVL